MHLIISLILSRIRFACLDIIDMRANNWIPRTKEVKAKTLAEIQADFNKDEIEKVF